MARPTILVVEERELALLLRRILRTSGYRVLICRTGGQALRICSRFSLRIDLVLTTLQLPDIDGGALILNLEREYPYLKIIGMSLYQGRAIRFAGPGISFIQKPFNYVELIARIRKVLGG
jgi:DNA-binding response OmpR family regulator